MRQETMMFAVRLVARRKLSRKDFRRFIKLYREDPKGNGISFRETVLSALACELETSFPEETEVAWSTDGAVTEVEAPVTETFGDFFQWLRENWEAIAKMILFIIGLFASETRSQ